MVKETKHQNHNKVKGKTSVNKSSKKFDNKVKKSFNQNKDWKLSAIKHNKSDNVNVKSNESTFKSKKIFDKKDNFKRKRENDTNESKDKNDIRIKRKSKKSNFTLVEDLKGLWNKIRSKKTSQSDRDNTIVSILNKLKGQISTLCLRHDVARIIQFVIQYSNESQRKMILLEILPKFSELCKTPYGHFTCIKLINYCNNITEQSKICHSVKNHFISIGTNVIGARIVELLLSNYPTKLMKTLKAEFYGHKYTILLPDTCPNLHFLLTHLPTKESPILDHMRDLSQKFIEKGLLVFKYVHGLLWEYVCEITNKPKRLHDFIEMIIDNYSNLLSTKSGSKIACVLATYTQPKDRKKIIKSLKNNFAEALLSDISYLPILRIIDVTDDTVNIQKSLLVSLRSVEPIVKYSAAGDIIGTPFPLLISISKHKYASKLLIRLLDPLKNVFEPDQNKLFVNPNDIVIFKKDPKVRRNEHLTYLKNPLLYVCNKYLLDLIRCPYGSKVLETVVKCFNDALLIKNIARAVVGLDIIEPDELDNEPLDDEMVDDEEINEDNNEEIENSESYVNDEEGNVATENNINYWDEDEENTSVIEEIDETEIDLPIHEDSNTHKVLKSLLKFELLIENQENDIDKTLWSVESFDLSIELSNNLIENENCLELWLKSNRSCLIILDLIKLQSSKKLLNKLSNESTILLLEQTMTKGGKILLEQIKTIVKTNDILNSKKKSKKNK